MKNSSSEKQQWTRNGRNWRKFSAWKLDEKSEVRKQVIEEARDVGALQFHFCIINGTSVHLKNAELEAKTPENTKGRVVLRGDILKKIILDLMQYSLNKDLQHLK